MNIDQIKKLLNSGAGIAMKKYLTLKLNELKSIDCISEKDTAVHQALEVKAQKRAYNKLKEILQEIITLSEVIKPIDKRDSYGVTDDDII